MTRTQFPQQNPPPETKEHKYATKTRDQLASMFIDSLNENELPWKACWQSAIPENAISHKNYKGINRLYLGFVALKKGWKDPRWCTFNQITAKGWHLQKGSKGYPVEYWAYYDKEQHKVLSWDDARDMLRVHPEYEDDRLVLRSRTFTVFNAAQIDGMPERAEPHTDISEIRANRDKLIANMGVGYEEKGDSAYYSPKTDTVTLPPENTFDDAYGYMATLLHECGHATGHETRLNRPIQNYFGTEDYAREELRAEIAATFTAQSIGLPMSEKSMQQHWDTHKAYIQSWISVLEKNPNELFAAIKAAEEISDYLIEKGEFEVVRDKPEQEQKTPAKETTDVPDKQPTVQQNEVVARYQSTVNMEPGYVNQIAIIREKDGYHNHFFYDERKGKGAAGTGAFATLDAAVRDVRAHCPDMTGLYRYYATQRPLGLGCQPKMDGFENVTNFDGKIYCEEIGRDAWGYVEYPAPLTPKQISSYELTATIEKAAPVIKIGRDEKGAILAFIPAVPQLERKQLTLDDTFGYR